MSASHSTTSCCFDLCQKIIGWTKYYVGFSRPAIFLIGLVVGHGFVDYAIVVQLILKVFVILRTHQYSAAVVNAADGIIAILFVILAHLSETCIGGFAMVLCTTIAYFVGLLLMPFLISNASIYIGLGLIAIGKAGQDPLDLFLVDQLSVGPEERNENTLQKCIARAGFWWFVLIHIGSTLAAAYFATSLAEARRSMGFLIYIALVGVLAGAYSTSIIVMFAALVWFLFGTCCGSYYYRKPAGSPLTTIYKVIKAAIRKRHMDYPETPSGYFQFSPHHPILSWIDKAAIIEPSSNQSHRLEKKCCSIAEVQKVKRLLTLIPLWTTFIVYSIVHGTGNTFLIEQGIDLKSDFMNYSLPVTVFFIIRSLISSATSLLFSSLLPKTWSVVLKQRVTLARIASGMALSILYCFVSWQVEVHRLKLAKIANASSSEERPRVIPMSIFWLTPQFVMLGLMDGLVEGGLNDFYDNYIDKSMKRFRRPFNIFVLGTPKFLCVLFVSVIFKSWFSGLIIDESHLDRYFLMLAILSCGNLCLHAFISYKYTSEEVLQWKDDDGQEEPQQMNVESSNVAMGDQFSLY